MPSRRTALLVSLTIGLAAGASYPFIDLALACRVPASEACVWGKAYFPLTLGISLVLLGGLASALAYGAIGWLRRRRGGGDGV